MIQKALQAGSHSGGKVECRRGDPPQAENPAKQDSNSFVSAGLLTFPPLLIIIGGN